MSRTEGAAGADASIVQYPYETSGLGFHHAYLLPGVEAALREQGVRPPAQVFDLGCGNGSVAAHLAAQGFAVSGIDPSVEGIAQARAAYPALDLRPGSAYDDLAADFGTFPALVSLEVVEHLYFPRTFAKTVHDLLAPGGVAVISTPYHGYLKNLALAVTGQMDQHFTALVDHMHIKFWSIKTLSTLLEEAGLEIVEFKRVGRIPALAKSMIAIARRPA